MTIDVHAHFVPTVMFEKIQARGADYGVELVPAAAGNLCVHFEHGQQIRPFFDGLTDIEKRIDAMERQGVQREVLSLWADIFGYGLPADKGAAWHTLLNDSLRSIADAHPGRFSWLASGALQDSSAAAREVERCKSAGAVGAIVAANLEGENLGDVELEEFWAACSELDMPVFIHPALPVPVPRAGKYGLQQIVAYTSDSTLTVGSLIFSGVLDRHPGLTLLLSHGGGALPYLIGRFDRMHQVSDRQALGNTAAQAPSAYLERFYYDTILHGGPALRYLRDLVGLHRMVLGTDLPFPIGDHDPLATLLEANFTAGEIDQIAKKSPRALFSLPD